MECKMAEQQKIVPRNKVLKVATLGALGLSAVLLLARLAGILPTAQDMSPAGAITFCVIMTAVTTAFAGWYFIRTDEHDLHANLWSMAWAWLVYMLLTINWFILHVAGVAPSPNALLILCTSTAVAAAIWAWMRFR
jgi:hypothetical protein